MVQMFKFKKLFLIAAALLLLGSCSGTGNNQTAEGFRVYTSFYPIYDLARTLTEDTDAEVIQMIPSGTEAHDWEPTPKDMENLKNADLFLYCHSLMEPWAEKVIPYGKENMTAAALADGLIGAQQDPHIWLDPAMMGEMAKKAADALSQADAAHSEIYRSNLTSFLSALDTLDQDYHAVLDNAANKTLVAAHGAYGYLCSAYGLTQVAIEENGLQSDPTPTRMAELSQLIQEQNILQIFYDPAEGSKSADTLAKEAGIRTEALYTFENGPENMGYIQMMRENLEKLKAMEAASPAEAAA